jgi:hypothetical protein
MPNRLRYCGPDENATLLGYALAGSADLGLKPLLQQFEGALPYLKLIAHSNGIADPFDERVVEAYWLGNSLLETVEVRQLHEALLARVKPHLSGRALEWVLGKAPAGARPHHSFHVFDVYSRIGDFGHSLPLMDQCRVSWGRVTGIQSGELIVERQPLALENGQLMLDQPRVDHVTRQLDGHGFADDAVPGDWVSLHWGWVCEVISADEQRRLERYTRYHLAIANQTL